MRWFGCSNLQVYEFRLPRQAQRVRCTSSGSVALQCAKCIKPSFYAPVLSARATRRFPPSRGCYLRAPPQNDHASARNDSAAGAACSAEQARGRSAAGAAHAEGAAAPGAATSVSCKCRSRRRSIRHCDSALGCATALGSRGGRVLLAESPPDSHRLCTDTWACIRLTTRTSWATWRSPPGTSSDSASEPCGVERPERDPPEVKLEERPESHVLRKQHERRRGAWSA